jgi:DNA-binding MarR family transcriptional regulator
MSKEKEFHALMKYIDIYHRINQNYYNSPRHYGIEEPLYQTEAHVIENIGENPGLSLMELAELTVRTKSSMSMMISKLAKKDLVKRERTNEDNRRYSITLTDKGKVVFDYHERLDAANYKEILAIMSDGSLLKESELKTANKVYKSLIKAMLHHEFTEI